MTLTAEQIFNQAMDAEYDRKDLAEAITLYQAAAKAYREEGSEADAKVAEFMANDVLTKQTAALESKNRKGEA